MGICSSDTKYPQTDKQKKTMKCPFIAGRLPKQVKLSVGQTYKYCGCGLSKNQPFCDDSHRGTPFKPIIFKAKKEVQKARNCPIVMATIGTFSFDWVIVISYWVPLFWVILRFSLFAIIYRQNQFMVFLGKVVATGFTKVQQTISSLIRKYIFLPRYKFITVHPKTDLKHKYLPFEQWKATRDYRQRENLLVIYSLFCLGFLGGKTLFELLYDDREGYHINVSKPILARSLQYIEADLHEYLDPFMEIIPKNRYEITRVYPRLFELIFKREEVRKNRDERVIKLKEEAEEFDKNNKYLL